MLQALHNCFGVYLAAQAGVAESLVHASLTKAIETSPPQAPATKSLVDGFLDDESSSLHLRFKSAEGVIARVKTNLPKARPKIDAAIKIKTRLDSKLEWRTFECTCPRIGWSIAWGRFFVKLML